MKKEIFILMAGCLMLASCGDKKSKDKEYQVNRQGKIQLKPVEEVSFQHVVITDKFWRPRIDKNRLAGIRSALKEASHDIDNFDIAAVCHTHQVFFKRFIVSDGYTTHIVVPH